MKKKIGIIGQFPPPMHGLSKALDTLYNSYLNEKFDFYKIDITDNKKFLLNLFKILFSKQDLYYLTISQSKFGNIRDLIIIKLIQLKQRKVIIHLHGGGFRNILDNEFSNLHRKLNCKILSKVDGGIVLGKSLKYIFKGIIPDEKIFIVQNCVDDQFVISDNEFDEKINQLENKSNFNILYLSNFIEDKGYKDVLELSKLVNLKGNKKFKFIFAGKFFDKEDEVNFLKYINENNLGSIVDYKGIVGGMEKVKLLKESDFFILLTRYKNEGQPISIIEAAANGLKVISTDHAGIKDILSGDEIIMIDKNRIDIENIYNELVKETIYKNIETLINNRDKILVEFCEKSYLKELENIFKKI